VSPHRGARSGGIFPVLLTRWEVCDRLREPSSRPVVDRPGRHPGSRSARGRRERRKECPSLRS
jgi:hypothetical protein